MTEALDSLPQGWWQPTEQEQLAIDQRAKAIADEVLAEIDTSGLPVADLIARAAATAAAQAAVEALQEAQRRALIDDGGPGPNTVWSSQRIEEELLRVRGANGQPRFAGVGPPPVTIIGAEPGDIYLDVANGDTYTEG